MKNYTMPQFMQALNRMSADVRGNALRKAALAGGQLVQGYAEVNVMETFKNVTGNLAGSIQTEVASASPDRVVVEVGPTAIYGRIQELGGEIKPLTAKRLHWVDEDGNHRTALSVTLPARPYLAPALEDNESEVIDAMGDVLRQAIEGAL